MNNPFQKQSAYTLGLHCTKCTREHRIGGDTPEQCYQGAEILGWVVNRQAGSAICPKCPAIRTPFRVEQPEAEASVLTESDSFASVAN